MIERRWKMRNPTPQETNTFIEAVADECEQGLLIDEIYLVVPSLCSLRVKMRSLIEAAKKKGHVINIVSDTITRTVKTKRGKWWIEIPQTKTTRLFRYDFSKGVLDMAAKKAKKAKKAKNKKVAKANPSPSRDSRLPVPGTVLTRKYKGKNISIKVLDKGIEYKGKVYRSLTAVADAVTGSHLNGYRFFDLK